MVVLFDYPIICRTYFLCTSPLSKSGTRWYHLIFVLTFKMAICEYLPINSGTGEQAKLAIGNHFVQILWS